MKYIYWGIFSGILLALSWPTYGASMLIFIALSPLLWAEKSIRETQSNTKRRVFLTSYITFLIWNTATTWWIWYSTIVGALFAILVNSLLMTLVFVLYHIVAKRSLQMQSLIFLVTLWISFEKFHLWWDFSWPWLNLGNVFSENITWVQWYEYTGIFGGTLWVWLVNICVFITMVRYQKFSDRKIITLGFAKVVLFITIPIIISWSMYLSYKDNGEPVQVIVLQPNIDPYTEKYEISNAEITQLMIRLASEKIDSTTHYVIAPETVFADNIPIKTLRFSSEIQELKKFISSFPRVSWLSGVAMYDVIFDKENTTSQSNYIPERNIWFDDYNSAFFIDNQSDSVALYHKTKLVVGVENLPYQHVLKPIFGDIMIDLGGTVALKTTQKERRVFQNGFQQKIAPVICYETLYGEFITDYIKNGGQFIAIMTNDAWWRNTQGHKQLLSYSRLRAIESRKSIARSANTGISALIDSKGNILQSIDYQEKGSLKGTILLNNIQTFYVRYGDYIARISIFITISLLLILLGRKKKNITLNDE